jgi:hypothetical protein
MIFVMFWIILVFQWRESLKDQIHFGMYAFQDPPLCSSTIKKHHTFYVTDGNIMYLTDASRFLISCVIQHYAPVVGWGGGGTDA